MRDVGLPVSVALHVGIFALAWFGLPSAKPTENVVFVDAVEGIEIGDVTQLRLGEREAKASPDVTPKDAAKAKEEREGQRAGTSKAEEAAPAARAAAAAPKPEPRPEPPKPVEPPKPPEPVKAPEPRPEPPKPTPVKAPEPKPVEAERAPEAGEGAPPKDEKALEDLIKKAEPPKPPEPPKPAEPAEARPTETAAVPQARPRPKPTPPAPQQVARAETGDARATGDSKFDPKKIENIVSRNQTGTNQSTQERTASLGSPRGTNAAIKMSQTEIDALVGQIRRCWNPPPGAVEAGITVTLRFALNQDGSLQGGPVIAKTPDHPLAVPLANSASRALRMCGPYKLPAEKYAVWQQVEATFDPKDL